MSPPIKPPPSTVLQQLKDYSRTYPADLKHVPVASDGVDRSAPVVVPHDHFEPAKPPRTSVGAELPGGWHRAQVASRGIDPDTGVDVPKESKAVEAARDQKYQQELAHALEEQKRLDNK